MENKEQAQWYVIHTYSGYEAMVESNLHNMVENNSLQDYIFEVVLRDGIIKLDWHDFEMKAQESRPAVAVKVDEPFGLSRMTAKALEEINENIEGMLTGLIVVISYKKDKELMMEELGGLNDSLSRLAEENVDINWGIQQDGQITNGRCITVYAFEKI